MDILLEAFETGSGQTHAAEERWISQSFPVMIPHHLSKVELKLFRVGTPHEAGFYIQVGDPETHLPTGEVVYSTSFNADELTESTSGQWYLFEPKIDLTEPVYCFVLSAPQGWWDPELYPFIDDAVVWSCKASLENDFYPGGKFGYSDDSGETWQESHLNQDCNFREYAQMEFYHPGRLGGTRIRGETRR